MLARAETNQAFYGRRALEEARAAARATNPTVGAAHRHMAAVYAARLREEEGVPALPESVLSELSHLNLTEFEIALGIAEPRPAD